MYINMFNKQVLKEPEVRQQASVYEEGKPLTGKIDAKTNKITVSKKYKKKNTVDITQFQISLNKFNGSCSKAPLLFNSSKK